MIFASAEEDTHTARLSLLSSVASNAVVDDVVAALASRSAIPARALGALKEKWTLRLAGRGLVVPPGPGGVDSSRSAIVREQNRSTLLTEPVPAIPTRRLPSGGAPARVMGRPVLGDSSSVPVKRVSDHARSADVVYLLKSDRHKVLATVLPETQPAVKRVSRRYETVECKEYRIVECNPLPLLGCAVKVLRDDGVVLPARISFVHKGKTKVHLTAVLQEAGRSRVEDIAARWPSSLGAPLAADSAPSDDDSIGVDRDFLAQLSEDSDLDFHGILGAIDPGEDAAAVDEGSLHFPSFSESAEVRCVPFDLADKERYLGSLSDRSFRVGCESSCVARDEDALSPALDPQTCSTVVAVCSKTSRTPLRWQFKLRLAYVTVSGKDVLLPACKVTLDPSALVPPDEHISAGASFTSAT